MPCGKHPLRKTWDKPRDITFIKSSRYEKNESSVKAHWKNVVRALEMSYKDEQFWESNCNTVRNLVGLDIFLRVAKIFNLPVTDAKLEPSSPHISDLVPSKQFYTSNMDVRAPRYDFSDSSLQPSEVLDSEQEQEQSTWTMSSIAPSSHRFRSTQARSQVSTKSVAASTKKLYSKTFSKFVLKMAEFDRKSSKSKVSKTEQSPTESSASSQDDLCVNPGTTAHIEWERNYYKQKQNPYHDMLYCNESETDMIKWKSNYKQKTFEVSASDEFSKRAEIMTKQISKDFFDWWVGLGNVEFKSEIKRPEDIEALFQVWFEEHASRGLVLHPKILPCVLKHIAERVGVPQASCPEALKRQIKYDIKAETMPAHLKAFGTSLPHHLTHVPPKNNTSRLWRGVQIPEDLRTMSCVWGDIQHLTSTKAFHKWLVEHPSLPMPPFLEKIHAADKKAPLVVPSDFIVTDKSATASGLELSIPISQFSIEVKAVLSKLMSS